MSDGIQSTDGAAAPLTCSICQCASAWRAAFTEIKDGTAKRLCCPACARKLQTKWSRISLIALPLAVALSIYTHSAAWQDPIHQLLTLGCFIVAAQYPLVVLHELGHAVAARLAGAPPYAIVIGSEPWLVDRAVGSIRWRVGYWILGGLTYHSACEGPRARRNSILIVAAGPLTNLVIAAIAIPVALTMPGNLAASLGRLALFAFGLASALQFVRNAWPRQIKTSVGMLANDGARIVALWRGAPIAQSGPARAAELYVRATFAFADQDFELAETVASEAQRECEHADLLAAAGLLRGAALSESDRVAEAVAHLRMLLDSPIANPGLRAGVEDNLAWAYFLVDESAAYEPGFRLVESARALAPWEDSIAITHACLLAATASAGNGRVLEARALLAGLRAPRVHRPNRAYAALARGLIACSDGDFDAARSEFDDAKSWGATAAPLRVLERRIASH
jgi:hypothetical protein